MGKLGDWIAGQSAWVSDALHRAALADGPTTEDATAIAIRVQAAHGITVGGQPECMAFDEACLARNGTTADHALLCSIGPLDHVDRLAPGQELKFALDGLTINRTVEAYERTFDDYIAFAGGARIDQLIPIPQGALNADYLVETDALGSGLVDQSHKMTVAAKPIGASTINRRGLKGGVGNPNPWHIAAPPFGMRPARRVSGLLPRDTQERNPIPAGGESGAGAVHRDPASACDDLVRRLPPATGLFRLLDSGK